MNQRRLIAALRGFTLLEVMMALAVMATAGLSVLSLSGEVVRNMPLLSERNLARLVADNQMVDLMLGNPQPQTNWQWQQQELAGQTWFTRSRRVETALPEFQAYDVEVRLQREEDSQVLATLRSYKVRQ